MRVLDASKLLRDPIQGRVPGNLFPVVAAPEQRNSQPIRRIVIGPAEPSLHTGMALIRRPIVCWRHHDHSTIPHAGVERTAYAAIGAGGAHGLGGYPLR